MSSLWRTWLLLAMASSSAAAGLDGPTRGQAPQVLSLAGEWKATPSQLRPANAYLESIDDSEWEVVSVPSNWYLEGKEWAGGVWYRRTFTLPPSSQGKIVKLIFEGVDYAADVWLNGSYLGFHEGYFQTFSFSLGSQLRFDRPNLLVVHVDSPYERADRDWSLRKRMIKGVLGHHDTRPGGAWSSRGQVHNSGGIWAPVYLKISDRVSIDRLKATPVLTAPLGDPARNVKVPIALALTSAAGPQPVTIDLRLVPENFKPATPSGAEISISRRLRPGQQDVVFDVICPTAYLWWTWDRGPSRLYRIEAEIRHKGRLLDRASSTFGFRTIEVDTESGTFLLNGKRLFLRGTNYIGSHWLGEMTAERYGADLALMRQANVNAVRVHAHVAGGEFYDQSDRFGILVWQDFPLQWGYEDSPELHRQVMRQAKDMVRLLGHHPSIGLWSGHNEPPWDADWMKYKYATYDKEQNRALDDALFETLKAEDSSRYVHKVSATAEHPWFGWYSGSWTDYKKASDRSIISEFGAQALPDLETLRHIVSPSALFPQDEEDWEEWRFHNFQRKETFEIAGVKRGETTVELVEATQSYQSRLIQLAAESYRRQRFDPVTAIFQFMFVEAWPSMSWGVVDHRRRPKPGFEALRRAYQPVLVSIEWSSLEVPAGEPLDMALWVINDTPGSLVGAELNYAILRGETVISEGREKVDSEPDSSARVRTIDTAVKEPGTYLLLVKLTSPGLSAPSVNALTFEVTGG